MTLRGSECNRGTGCGKTARPGLHGGCRVTGIPTVALEPIRDPGGEAVHYPDGSEACIRATARTRPGGRGTGEAALRRGPPSRGRFVEGAQRMGGYCPPGRDPLLRAMRLA